MLQHEEEYSSQVPTEDYQARNEHMCGLLQYSLYGTRDAAQAQSVGGGLASTPSDLKLTPEVSHARACVAIETSRESTIVATVHGDFITIGGERSAVELLIEKYIENQETDHWRR